MARYQYRVCGELGWMSNSGNALIHIANPSGSGKKLTIRSFEINPLHSATNAPVSAASTVFLLARATISGGIKLTPTRLDTDAPAWPSTVELVTRAGVASPGAVPIRRIAVAKQMIPTGLQWFGKQGGIKGCWAAVYNTPRRDADTEGVVVRAGEGLALYCSVLSLSIPLRVSVNLSRLGSPNRSYALRFFTSPLATGGAIFAINNLAGSGETVVLRSISVEEVGTFDSPYFQLVPGGQLVEGESTESVSILKMDTNYPSPASWIQVKQDVAMLPFGMPENALADSSSGSPKGFNYLKTKDFLGPVYRTLFPEFLPRRLNAVADFIPIGHKYQDQFFRQSGITIREGESIALVSGAETAAGATTAVGVSGWACFEFAATIDVEPKLAPTLTLIGLKPATEVRIFKAGTTIEVAGQETIDTGTFSWVFDPEETPAVDIAVLSETYQNLRLANFSLSLADVTIPIQQQSDRQYANPT